MFRSFLSLSLWVQNCGRDTKAIILNVTGKEGSEGGIWGGGVGEGDLSDLVFGIVRCCGQSLTLGLHKKAQSDHHVFSL
jgi:hypothetical protein